MAMSDTMFGLNAGGFVRLVIDAVRSLFRTNGLDLPWNGVTSYTFLMRGTSSGEPQSSTGWFVPNFPSGRVC